ncbi:Bax inhibitor-1/YccA family protein [Chitinivorax sp. B]|uniref:Bax inhibitor-1/YccA family protein n=1 Tax=Chitinivorax sp. B TaxID=2502235 RepID=UPI0010F9F382|nr:Bax inhibitor-1/YccA family protein [Chitinivorax sp. B]
MENRLHTAYQGVSGAVIERNRVLRNTYMLLGLSMLPTVAGALVGVQTKFWMLFAGSPIMAPLLFLAGAFGFMWAIGKNRDSGLGVGLLLAFTFFMGLMLSVSLSAALRFSNGGTLIAMAAGGTGIIFASLATLATVTKKDFSFMGKFLFIGLVLLFAASIANIFFAIPALSLTISAIAVLLFSAYILYDISQIVNGGETNYVIATLQLYLDIYNVFVHLLNLLMAFGGERD